MISSKDYIIKRQYHTSFQNTDSIIRLPGCEFSSTTYKPCNTKLFHFTEIQFLDLYYMENMRIYLIELFKHKISNNMKSTLKSAQHTANTL